MLSLTCDSAHCMGLIIHVELMGLFCAIFLHLNKRGVESQIHSHTILSRAVISYDSVLGNCFISFLLIERIYDGFMPAHAREYV